jgi:ribosome-binding protein aMBF1 (putative translation factor)
MNKYTEPCKLCGEPITGITQYKRITGYTCYVCKTKRHRIQTLARARANRDKINAQRREKTRLKRLNQV